MNVAAEENELQPIYNRLGEKGKESLQLTQLQTKHIKDGEIYIKFV
jgi:hypothetical protein